MKTFCVTATVRGAEATCDLHVRAETPEEAERIARELHGAGVFANVHFIPDQIDRHAWSAADAVVPADRIHLSDPQGLTYDTRPEVDDIEVSEVAETDAREIFDA